MTGNDVLRLCKRDLGTCAVHIDGAVDGYMAGYIQGAGDAGGMQSIRAPWCTPDKVTYAQVEQIVIDYLTKNPQMLHLDFSFLAAQAAKSAFPCPK